MNRLLIFSLIIFSLISCKDNEDPDAAFKAQQKQIDDRITQLGFSDEVLYTSSGARMIIHSPGNGAPPHTGQKVNAIVTGELFSDGSTFTASPSVSAKLEDITPTGLSFCLGLLMEGSSATIYLPSKLGYGTTGTTGVPANSILVYEVSLEDVERTTTEQTQFTTDTSKISAYVFDNNINATGHPSGIWYTVDTPGTGVSPTPYSIASFEYKLKLLTQPGTVIQQGPLSNQHIFGLIDGLKIGMPLMNVGSKYTFYVPSGLAYGPTGTTGIAANSNLIFEITLTAVSQ